MQTKYGNSMKIALVGATGLVGSVMLEVLAESNILKNIELIPAASERSVGKIINFKGKKMAVVSISDAIAAKPDFAIFSAGSDVSLLYAPKFAENGTVVVDNSSAWRACKPLIVPQINFDAIEKDDRIIANPNCSTIQLVMALAPLHSKFRIKRLVISTYQSVTGSGVKGVNQLEQERCKMAVDMCYPHSIDLNLIPHGGNFMEDGYTSEEIKLVNETRKILRDNDIRVTATVVRVPVKGGHSESVNIEFEKDFDIDEVFTLLSEMPGVVIQDDIANNVYPMPLMAHGKNEVFVGRIRRDMSNENSLNLWIVADNLRKGAATNAVEIVEFMVNKNEQK